LIAEKGGSFLADPGMRPPEVLRELRPEVTRYQLYLGEIDELMGKLFLVARLNSGFFFNRLDPVAKKYLHERNEAFPAE